MTREGEMLQATTQSVADRLRAAMDKQTTVQQAAKDAAVAATPTQTLVPTPPVGPAVPK